jgi:dynein heavy chain
MTNFNILFSKDFSLQKTMSDPITIGKWTNQDKLPNDSFSVDNAIILLNSPRWPLMIDPQNQATNWIKTTYGPAKTLQIIKPSQDEGSRMRVLELAISLGQQVMLVNMGENIDSIF